MRYYIFNLRQNDHFLILFCLFLLLGPFCLECELLLLMWRLISNLQVWCNLERLGVVGEHVISHKAPFNNAIFWYIANDNNLIDTKPLFNWCLSMTQSQNQLNDRWKIMVLCCSWLRSKNHPDIYLINQNPWKCLD